MQWLQIQQSSQELLTQFSESGREKRTEVCQVPEKNNPANPWRNAGRMGINFAAFEALLSQSTTAATAHLTAWWPALKEEMQERECQLEVYLDIGFIWASQTGKTSFQVWGTTAELLRLESKRTVDLNSTSYTFILHLCRGIHFGTVQQISHLIASYSILQEDLMLLWGPQNLTYPDTQSFWWSKMMHFHNVK